MLQTGNRIKVSVLVAARNEENNIERCLRSLHELDFPKENIEMAEQLKNPLDSTAAVVASGKALYNTYCQHCHGETGAGDGKVAGMYKGVPNYSSDAYKAMNEGHIFHVITHGKARMWPHGSQVNPEERWKIVHYVQTLQQGA